MANYAFAYYSEPKFDTPEAGSQYRAKWQAWMSSLGDALVNPGFPLGMSQNVSSRGISNNGGANRLTGFSIVKADSLDAAVALAQKCPHLEHGSIDVAETMDMGM